MARNAPIILVLALLALPTSAFSQEAENAPPRSLVAMQALMAAEFDLLEPGLELMRASGGGILLTVLRIDQRKFRFGIETQTSPDGERVDAFGRRADAVIAVNGGFFGEKAPQKALYPVGILRVGGEVFSANWAKTGGYLLFGKAGLSIAKSADPAPAAPATVLQSKPLVIEPGGQWAMNTNQENWRPRTLVCSLPDNKILLLLVWGGGMSLYEAGWLLRPTSDGGLFGCDAALALDGGSSTQLWVDGREELAIAGETAVHNALVIKRR